MQRAGSSTPGLLVSIDKQYPGQAFKVMNALWGAGLMSLAKVIVVVDKHVDVRDPDEAWWIALNNIDPERDTRFTMGPVDVLDHASRGFTYGSKMGIDGTRKWPEEGFTREWPPLIVMDEATKRRVDELWPRVMGEGIAPGRAMTQPAAPGREGQTFEGTSLLVRCTPTPVKPPHTLFALPFALLGVLAACGSPPRPSHRAAGGGGVRRHAGWRWATTGSPTAASTRWNPRTSGESCRAGPLALAQAWILVAAAAVFVGAAWLLNLPMAGSRRWRWSGSWRTSGRSVSPGGRIYGWGSLAIAPSAGYLAVTAGGATPGGRLLVDDHAAATGGRLRHLRMPCPTGRRSTATRALERRGAARVRRAPSWRPSCSTGSPSRRWRCSGGGGLRSGTSRASWSPGGDSPTSTSWCVLAISRVWTRPSSPMNG
ncbi:MAG: UbiD family decarboxylase [Gemmatimonadales bacterium]